MTENLTKRQMVQAMMVSEEEATEELDTLLNGRTWKQYLSDKKTENERKRFQTWLQTASGDEHQNELFLNLAAAIGDGYNDPKLGRQVMFIPEDHVILITTGIGHGKAISTVITGKTFYPTYVEVADVEVQANKNDNEKLGTRQAFKMY